VSGVVGVLSQAINYYFWRAYSEMEEELDLYLAQFVGRDEQQLAQIKEQRRRVKESVVMAAKQACK
jgi:hypothetical protein